MSASPVARQVTQSQAIPRRVTITNASQLPNDYSTTPGGTIYSTTPGGTRIVYERAFLMQLRNSPMARTPPKNMPMIPGLSPSSISPSKLVQDNSNSSSTAPAASILKQSSGGSPPSKTTDKPTDADHPADDQFQMEL